LAKDNEAARVIAETGTGWTIAPDDVEGIMARLDALVRQGPRLEYDDARIARYIYPAPAEALEVEIELAIEGRRATA
jgi:hypothetical protein